MRTMSILSLLLLTAVSLTFGLTDARAGFPSPPGLPAPPGLPGSPNLNVHVNGYLPAPPGVNVQIDGGRPYYADRDQRVYLERERPYRRYNKERKHHQDRGHKFGHYKQEKHGH